jgi:hypothetical protein
VGALSLSNTQPQDGTQISNHNSGIQHSTTNSYEKLYSSQKKLFRCDEGVILKAERRK